MRVKLLRRWGSTPAGQSVDVDPTQGRWLIDHAFGVAKGEPAPVQAAAAPGEAGSDPLASGDGTRQGIPATIKGERRDNNAAPLPGSPGHEGDAASESAKPAAENSTPTATPPAGQARTRRRRKTTES